jgi:hypothetical protein
MNKERIKLLANQALDEVVPYTWTTLSYGEVQKLQNRFAELIVREFIDIIDASREEAIDLNLSGGESMSILKHYTKKRFGVE